MQVFDVPPDVKSTAARVPMGVGILLRARKVVLGRLPGFYGMESEFEGKRYWI